MSAQQDHRQGAQTAIGLLAGVVAGGIGALWLGVYGLLVMIAAGMIRVGCEVWKLRRATAASADVNLPTLSSVVGSMPTLREDHAADEGRLR